VALAIFTSTLLRKGNLPFYLGEHVDGVPEAKLSQTIFVCRGLLAIVCRRVPQRRKYADLKRDLASICRDDREAYTTSKADFIREVLDNSGNSTDASSNGGLG
jgi:hypothetical protein